MSKIDGGYYIKARCIQESEIQHAPPHVREIWDWFIMQANHTPYKKYGNNFERGQLLCTYANIQEALHWTIGWRKKTYSKGDCETAMKWLKKRTMVTTRKTTKGMIVTICNYSRFQDPKNYETYKETPKKPTVNLQTDDSINKKDKNEKKVNTASESFKLFYKEYPKKKSKGQAESRWKTINPNECLFSSIMTGLESAKLSEDWTKDNGKYIPHPATWLNAKGWEDEAAEARDISVSVDKCEPILLTKTEFKQWKADNGR